MNLSGDKNFNSKTRSSWLFSILYSGIFYSGTYFCKKLLSLRKRENFAQKLTWCNFEKVLCLSATILAISSPTTFLVAKHSEKPFSESTLDKKKKQKKSVLDLIPEPISAILEIPIDVSKAIFQKTPLKGQYNGFVPETDASHSAISPQITTIGNDGTIKKESVEFIILNHDGKNSEKIQYFIDKIQGRLLINTRIGQSILRYIFNCDALLIHHFTGITVDSSQDLDAYCKKKFQNLTIHPWVKSRPEMLKTIGEPKEIERKFSFLLTKHENYPYDSWTHKDVTYVVIRVDDYNELKLDLQQLTYVLAHEMAIYFDSLTNLGTKKSIDFLDEVTSPAESAWQQAGLTPRFDPAVKNHFKTHSDLRVWASLNAPNIAVVLAQLRAFRVEQSLLNDLKDIAMIEDVPYYGKKLAPFLNIDVLPEQADQMLRFKRLSQMSQKMLPYNTILLAHSKLYFYQKIELFLNQPATFVTSISSFDSKIDKFKKLISKAEKLAAKGEFDENLKYSWPLVDRYFELSAKTVETETGWKIKESTVFAPLPWPMKEVYASLVRLPREAEEKFDFQHGTGHKLFPLTGLSQRNSFLLRISLKPHKLTTRFETGPTEGIFIYAKYDFLKKDLATIKYNSISQLQNKKSTETYDLLKFFLTPILSDLQVNANTGPRPRIMFTEPRDDSDSTEVTH